MNLALECPMWMNNEVQPLADFDFVLTHLVLKSEEYADYYKKSGRFKILDNSINELGYPTSLEDIQKAAEIILPDYICPPDHLGEQGKTFLELEKAIKIFGSGKIIPIVQGMSISSVLDFVDLAGERVTTNILAIPFDIMSNAKSATSHAMAVTRFEVVSEILKMSGSGIHLLGLTDPAELELYSNKPNVISLDTGTPILNGMLEKDLTFVPALPKGTQIDYEPEIIPDIHPYVYKNIAYIRRLMTQTCTP